MSLTSIPGCDFKALADASIAKHVNNMRLQNLVMQLRKISSHPFLFDWPADESTNELVVNEDLVNASGKMLLLNRLLDELFKRGHKVLLFSQFTTMLDVIVSVLETSHSERAACLVLTRVVGGLGYALQEMGRVPNRRLDLARGPPKSDGRVQR